MAVLGRETNFLGGLCPGRLPLFNKNERHIEQPLFVKLLSFLGLLCLRLRVNFWVFSLRHKAGFGKRGYLSKTIHIYIFT